VTGRLIVLIPPGGASMATEDRRSRDGIPVFRIIVDGILANEDIVWS
jgi:hypothetical protein